MDRHSSATERKNKAFVRILSRSIVSGTRNQRTYRRFLPYTVRSDRPSKKKNTDDDDDDDSSIESLNQFRYQD